MNAPDDQDDDDAPVQRVVSAADGSPLHTAAASSVFTSWMKPGTTPPAAVDEPEREAEPEPEPTTTTTTGEEETMATRNKRSRGNPQLEICSALLQMGDLSRDAIGEACAALSSSQISSALNNAKHHGRIVFIEKDQVFRLTKEGKAWVAATTGEQPPEKPRKPKRGTSGRSKAHARRRAKPAPDEPPPEEPADEGPAFRCAVMSDGCFFITKDGTTIELEPDEHKQMLHYLERMAETA